LTKALIELGTTSDNVDIEIVERGTNGFLGIIGVRPWTLKVTVKKKTATVVKAASGNVTYKSPEKLQKSPIEKKDTEKMALYVNKILLGKETKGAKVEGYFERGIRHQVWLEEPVSAARRGVDMLLKKIAGEEYITELPIPKKDLVPIASPIKDLKKAKIAVLNTGGIVPVDNPDRIQSASATRWGRYNCSSMERLKGGEFKTIHAGFDPAAADANPNVIVPWDVLVELKKEGVFGELHEYFYSTVGTGTTQAEAKRMGHEMLAKLQEAGVDACIMVST